MRSTLRGAALTALLVLVLAPAAIAQTGFYDEYLNHQELTAGLQDLASRHGDLATLEPLARSDAGREVWQLTLGNPDGRPLDDRPAMLVVANLEGNHLVGSSAALYLAQHLLEGYGADEEITQLLDERTVYVFPRMNPDGAELVWSMPGYELPYKPHPDAPDQGGMNVRELGRDLNGDGLVTLMRVRDPEGSLMGDPDEPRLLREADRTRAERGVYQVYVEGIDPEDAEAYVPMGSDGVNLNRNFPHEYLYYQPHVGPHQVSEVETRALADFMFEQMNVAAVLTFSPYDNLRSPPPSQRSPPPGVAPGPPSIPTNILGQDRPYYQFISERFNEITGLSGEGKEGEAGSFPQFAYYQVGIPSFTTPVWALPSADGPSSPAPDPDATSPGAVEGTWSIQMQVEGQTMDAALTLSRDGPDLSGILESPAGSMEFQGSGQAGRFQLSGQVPQVGDVSVSGTVSGDQVSGSLGLGPMGSSSFTGSRTGGQARMTTGSADGDTTDHRWLAWFDAAGVDGFVEWEEAEHPTLGTVEVGGFVPNARVNPPVEEVGELARLHAEFAVWLGGQLPELEIAETTVEARGDHVFHVTATVVNDQYLPTHLQMGERVRTNRPVTARLMPVEGMTVLSGNIQQQVPPVEGMGGRHTFTWLVQAPPGTDLTLELFAERAGGLQSTTITLR